MTNSLSSVYVYSVAQSSSLFFADAVKEINKALRSLGYTSFRTGQENAIARIVSGEMIYEYIYNISKFSVPGSL